MVTGSPGWAAGQRRLVRGLGVGRQWPRLPGVSRAPEVTACCHLLFLVATHPLLLAAAAAVCPAPPASSGGGSICLTCPPRAPPSCLSLCGVGAPPPPSKKPWTVCQAGGCGGAGAEMTWAPPLSRPLVSPRRLCWASLAAAGARGSVLRRWPWGRRLLLFYYLI